MRQYNDTLEKSENQTICILCGSAFSSHEWIDFSHDGVLVENCSWSSPDENPDKSEWYGAVDPTVIIADDNLQPLQDGDIWSPEAFGNGSGTFVWHHNAWYDVKSSPVSDIMKVQEAMKRGEL